MFVGEQPGDAEDLAGRPFVGPAGKLLDRALEEAGIDRRVSTPHRSSVPLTTRRGGRR
jgi:DNA polymerase